MGLSGSRTRKLILVNEGDTKCGKGGPLPPEITKIMKDMDKAEGRDKEPPKKDYWGDRVKQMQKKHDEIAGVMESAYHKAFEELGGKRPGKTSTYVPCAADTKKLIACYKSHPNEPMLCAELFQAFEECVTRERIEATIECCCE
nr:MICOS complex subunit MIC25-like [Onthophagus taurus]